MSDKVVSVRLTGDELLRLRARAKRERRTISGMAAILIVQGLDEADTRDKPKDGDGDDSND